MKLYYKRQIFTLIFFLFSLTFIQCGEDSESVSVTVSNKNKNEKTMPFTPKRSLPEKKRLEFKVIEKENPLQIDSKYIQNWMKELRQTNEFIYEMEMDSTSTISYDFTEKLNKDLNGDGIKDVVILIKKNIQDKKSFIRMYLFAFNDGEKLIPIEYFFGGSFESELLFEFRQITDSMTIVGELVPNHFVKSKDKFRIEYYFDGKEFIRK